MTAATSFRTMLLRTARTSCCFSTTSTPDLTSKARFYIPRAKRTATNSLYEVDTSYENRLQRKDRKSPTRELNYTEEHWETHKSPWRRIRHMYTTMGSSPMQRLAFPDLFVTAAVASGLTYYNTTMGVVDAVALSVPAAPFAGATTAIGLLAAFRLNGSYGRYDEARKYLGEINNATRDLAGQAMTMVPDQDQAQRLLKLLKSFPIAINFHLSNKGGHFRLSRLHPDFRNHLLAELQAELRDIWTDPTKLDFVHICDAYHNKRHVPLEILTYLREAIHSNQGDAIDPVYIREMDAQIQRLCSCLGACERILRTPIPTCFTRHTSRLFFMWSNLLPFLFYPTLGPWGTLPASLVVSYAVLGVEDIGVQLEEPFNILPIRQYSEGMADSVDAIEAAYKRSRSSQ